MEQLPSAFLSVYLWDHELAFILSLLARSLFPINQSRNFLGTFFSPGFPQRAATATVDHLNVHQKLPTQICGISIVYRLWLPYHSYLYLSCLM